MLREQQFVVKRVFVDEEEALLTVTNCIQAMVYILETVAFQVL